MQYKLIIYTLAFLPSYPSYITPKPEKEGKIVWFSGVPGAGKSTTAQMMAKEKGYVYYEADCTMGFTNPYLDIHAENVFNAQCEAKPLKVSVVRHWPDSRNSPSVVIFYP